MSKPAGSSNSDGPPDRDDVLAMLGETMQDVRERIEASDPQTPEEERLLIRWVRTQGYLAGQYRLLKADSDIDEMEDSLELIDRAQDLRGER